MPPAFAAVVILISIVRLKVNKYVGIIILIELFYFVFKRDHTLTLYIYNGAVDLALALYIIIIILVIILIRLLFYLSKFKKLRKWILLGIILFFIR